MADKVMKRFRLLRGSHAVKRVNYKANDPARNVVVSDKDLVKMFGAEKFEYLGIATNEGAQVPTSNKLTRKDLEDMTVPELRELASDEDIDLGTANRKDEIISTIMGVLETR